MKIFFRLYLVLSFLVVSGCSTSFLIFIGGNLDEGVQFKFHNRLAPYEQQMVDIEDFILQKEISDGQWRVIWRLSGQGSLNKISYGEKYRDLAEVISPEPLFRGETYRVLAVGRSIFGPSEYGATVFRLKNSGELEVIDSVRQ